MTSRPIPSNVLFSFARSVVFLLCVSVVSYAGDGSESNKFVRVHVETTQSTVQRETQGEFSILFTPIDGIHITSDPAMKIDIDRKGPFRLQGTVRQSVDSTTGYVSTDEPVRQAFSVLPQTPAGVHQLMATLTYYFCSDDEGWCRKFVHSIEFPVTIEKPVSNKR